MSELKSIKQEGNELCWEIEKLPASEQQTRVIVMACAFVSRAEKAEAKVRELEQELEDTKTAGLKDANLAIHLYTKNKELESSLAALREQTRWRKIKDGELPGIRLEDGCRVSAPVLVDWFHFDGNEQSSHFGESWREIAKAMVYETRWINLENGEEIEIDDVNAPTHWCPISLPDN